MSLQLLIAGAFVAVQGPLKMGLCLSGSRHRMGSPQTDPGTEGGGGLGRAGQGRALTDLPAHPFLALEAR